MIIRCLLFILLTSTAVVLPGEAEDRAEKESCVRRYTRPDGAEEYDKLHKDGSYTHCIISTGEKPHVSCTIVTFARLQWQDLISGPGAESEGKSGGRVVFDYKESLTILERLKTTYAQQER